jgi:GrpB-like predicted nucleotidyltransferase (UPF0157 family)
MAASEIARWRAALPDLVAVHHIGSTSVPGLCAKPILDLMPVFATEAAADAAQPILEALGYEWLGEHGLPGRRYCRRSDAATGLRRVQAHGYVTGHPDIARHLAFRDWLGADTAHRDAYAAEKARCAALHPGDGSAYGDCKSAWIDAAEQRALRDGRDRRW